MKKMFNNMKANLAAVLSAVVVNFFGAMAEKIDVTADEVAALREELTALREEVAVLRVQRPVNEGTTTEEPAEEATEEVKVEVAEEGYTDYCSKELTLLEGCTEDGGKVLSELSWKVNPADLIVTLMARGMHPALFDELSALGEDGIRTVCEKAKQTGYTMADGHFIPGYKSFKKKMDNLSNVSNTWVMLWRNFRTRKSDRYFEYGVFDMMCACARMFDVDWGKFVSNEMLTVPESTEPVVDWDSMGNMDFEGTCDDDYDEAAASLSDADVPPEAEAPAPEAYDPFADMDGYTNTCDDEAEEADAEEADATSMPEPEEADATEMPSEEADATEMPSEEADATEMPAAEGEDADATAMPEAEAEADATAMPEVDAEEATGDEPEQAHVPHADEDGKLVNPETFEYPEIPAVRTDWNKRLVIRNGVQSYICSSTWASAYIPVMAPEGELDAWSVAHAIYLQELLHWGFNTEAWTMADRELVGYDKNGKPLIANGRYWDKKLEEFRAAHPETAANRKQRMATFEFRAWVALYRNSNNTRQIENLLSTGNAHLLPGNKEHKPGQPSVMSRSLEYCRSILEEAAAKACDDGACPF